MGGVVEVRWTTNEAEGEMRKWNAGYPPSELSSSALSSCSGS